jgi:predicted ATP-binding protein involved in virulence
MEFDERLTVIVGGNGKGKTAVLDATATLFGRFLTRLPRVKGIFLKKSDIRIDHQGKLAPASRCSAEANATTEWMKYFKFTRDYFRPEWSTVKLRDTSPSTKLQALKVFGNVPASSFSEIDGFADELMNLENSNQPYQMPLIVYYGTDRAVFDSPIRRAASKKAFSRFASLADALDMFPL